MNKNKIYIGGGNNELSLLFLLPIVDGYCENNNIKHIIFSRELPTKVANTLFIKNILNKYHCEYIFKKNYLKNLKIFTLGFFFILFNIFKILFLVFFFNKKEIIDKKSASDKDLLLSFWEIFILQDKNHNFKKNFFKFFLIFSRCYLTIFISKVILHKNIKSAFLHHKVYNHRILLKILLKNKVKVFSDSGTNCSYMLYKSSNQVSFLKKDYIFLFKNFFTEKLITNYWKIRKRNKGNRTEIFVKNKGRQVDNLNSFLDNVIMMPSIKDTSFTFVDPHRIFVDVTDWLAFTINAIKDSNENWVIKVHPNSKRWGEDSKKYLDSIFSSLLINQNELKNIKILTNLSNKLVFNNSKRIVTFNGTAQYEAAAHGIKPIMISDTNFNKFQYGLTFKPKNQSKYKKMLLLNSSSNVFKLKSKLINYARFFIFISEHVISLSDELGKFYTLYGDSEKKKLKDFNFVRKQVKKNYNYLTDIGHYLGNKLNFAVSKKYIKYFI